jgi:hypothetical protein
MLFSTKYFAVAIAVLYDCCLGKFEHTVIFFRDPQFTSLIQTVFAQCIFSERVRRQT